MKKKREHSGRMKATCGKMQIAWLKLLKTTASEIVCSSKPMHMQIRTYGCQCVNAIGGMRGEMLSVL